MRTRWGLSRSRHCRLWLAIAAAHAPLEMVMLFVGSWPCRYARRSFIGGVTLASLLFLVRQDPGLENRRTRQPRDVKNFLFVEGFPRQQGFD